MISEIINYTYVTIYNCFLQARGQESAQPTAGTTGSQPASTENGTTPMFIEMGPEIVSVSSVTAQIVTESENPTTSSGNTGKRMFYDVLQTF